MPNLTESQKQRYSDLFNKLDTNSDGRIDVNDLVTAFEKNGIKHCNNNNNNLSRAKKFIRKGDKDASGNLTFSEFAQYMKDHENKLELVFRKMDTNNDNRIGTQELIGFFKALNVEITENEANRLVEKINRNGSLTIEPNEWRNYFLLAPIDDIDDLLYHWQHSTFFDVGETFTLPSLPEKEVKTSIWYRNFISGAIAGMTSRTCTAPFDRLKTVMQALGSRKHITIVGGFKHMLNEGGILSLWRGNGINVVKIGPEAALKFMFYEEIKTLFIKDKNREPTIVERFISGSSAGALAQTSIYPLEVLKTRLVLRKTGEYKNVFDCINQIIKREGGRAFFKGYLPNLLGIIPYAGVDLAVYETLKHLYMKRYDMVDNPAIPVLLLCGTTSTITGQLISYPLALVRTRLQAQEIPVNSTNCDTMSKILVRIWKNEGIRGLYHGLLPNIIKVVPAVSISYVVYEKMKKALIVPENKRSNNN